MIEYCYLNRNSFYYHFKDECDLVNWIFYIENSGLISEDAAHEISRWEMLERICQYFFSIAESLIKSHGMRFV